MTLETPLHGYSQWRLPSPSSTPKASGPVSPLRTPRTACSPSFFADIFNTPRPNGQDTPAQTPVYGSFVAAERPASSHTARHPLPEDAAFHVHHPAATPSLQLPPVSPTRRLSSSPNQPTSATGAVRDGLAEPVAGTQRQGSMNPFQMQTPPPTRDATSRQKKVPPHMTAMRTPASNVPHHVQTTPGDSGLMQPPPPLNTQTPFQFNSVQFSPNAFGFLESGPASAPVYPQSRLFWDPNNSQQGMEMDTANMHDPFAPQPQSHSPAPVWPSFQYQARMEQQMAQQISFATPQAPPFAQQWSSQTFWSPGDIMPRDSAPFTSPIRSASAFGFTSDAVSSFSSPPQAVSRTIQPSQIQMTHPRGGFQSHRDQSLGFNREQEQAKNEVPQHTRTSTASSTASTMLAARPGLQRSNTDSGTRRRLNNSTDSRLSTTSAEQQILRKPSPLKRNSQHSQTSLSAIPESAKPKAKTRLVIDENGTARTETVPAEPTVDSRRRSGIWDIDSDSDSEDEDLVPSQRSSFVFTGDTARRVKQARIDTAAELNKVARSGSSSSLSKMPFGVRRTASSSSRRGHLKLDPRRSSVASFEASSFTSEGAERSWEMEGVEEGDAQLALKKVIEDKLKRQEKSPEEKLAVHNQRWSLASADVAKLQPFAFDPPSSNPTSHPNISPSSYSYTGSFATPTTDRTSLSQGAIRCTCNHNQDDGSQMVQCESCQQWLHVRCVFHNQPVPPIFVCSFCTGFTPLARGGRIREPIRIPTRNNNNDNTFDSPLAGRANNPFR